MVDNIYLIEEGAVVETRNDDNNTSHATHFAGPGSLIGLRMASGSSAVHQTRATALAPTTVLSLDRTTFLARSMREPALSMAVMKELGKRTQIANMLSSACHNDSSRQHVLEVLGISRAVYGMNENGSARVAIPVGMMERICGCPWVLIRMALNDLQRDHLITITPNGVMVHQPN